MQGPSSSTSSDSAVCAGLWEAGVGCVRGFWSGGCKLLLVLLQACVWGGSDGEGKGDNTQQIS